MVRRRSGSGKWFSLHAILGQKHIVTVNILYEGNDVATGFQLEQERVKVTFWTKCYRYKSKETRYKGSKPCQVVRARRFVALVRRRRVQKSNKMLAAEQNQEEPHSLIYASPASC